MIVRIVIPAVPSIEGYLNAIVREWGGYTRTTLGTGAWLDHWDILVEEPITILDVHVGDDTPLCRKWWRLLANKIRRDLDQEIVYLQFSASDVEFVDGSDECIAERGTR